MVGNGRSNFHATVLGQVSVSVSVSDLFIVMVMTLFVG